MTKLRNVLIFTFIHSKMYYVTFFKILEPTFKLYIGHNVKLTN